MQLIKAAPIMANVKQDIDRLFDRFLGGILSEPIPVLPKPFETPWSPMLDLSETDREYVVRLEAPGVHKENLDVSVEGSVVTLSGRRDERKDVEGEEVVWREREFGKFVRTLRLPTAIDEGKVTAAYSDGILVVKLPKAVPSTKSKVAIR